MKCDIFYGMIKKTWLVIYGVIGIVVSIVIIALVLKFGVYGGAATYTQGFSITSPDVAVVGSQEIVQWSVSSLGARLYPTEKIEMCLGATAGDRCTTLRESVSNNRSANFTTPTSVPVGNAYIRMTGRDSRGKLVSSASTTRAVAVVAPSTIAASKPLQVTWKAGAANTLVRVQFCTPPNPTSSCIVLAASAKNTGSLQVAAPSTLPGATGYVAVQQVTSTGALVSGTLQYGTAQIQTTEPSLACSGASVKDFGVIGDGATDDTKAMQAAFNSTAADTICFPAGRYVISAPIIVNTDSIIRSDGGALIDQKCKTCNVFVFKNRYSPTIQGMKFLSGAFQVVVLNDTSKATHIAISNSEFQGATSYAVYTGTSPNAVMPGSVTISRSKFNKVRKVLRNVSASAVVRDTWVTVHKNNFDADSAVFWNADAASLTLDKMLGVPAMGAGDQHVAKTRWVDNYGAFTAVQTRFGGEDAGIPIVYAFDGNTPSKTSVVIRDSQISSGGGVQDDSSVIVLKSGIPRTVTLSGNNYLIGVPYILSQGLDIAQYLSSKNVTPAITIDANMAYPYNTKNPDIPTELEAFTKRQIAPISISPSPSPTPSL